MMKAFILAMASLLAASVAYAGFRTGVQQLVTPKITVATISTSVTTNAISYNTLRGALWIINTSSTASCAWYPHQLGGTPAVGSAGMQLPASTTFVDDTTTFKDGVDIICSAASTKIEFWEY